MTHQPAEPDSDRLHRIGITPDDLAALEHLWNTRAFYLTTDLRTGHLAAQGHSPLDSLDAIWHELEENPAHLCMQYGYTPHQAHLIDTSAQARNNLWGPNFDNDRVEHLLDETPLPRHLRLKILLVADSPTETDALVDYCTGEATHPHGHDHETVIAQVENRAALLNVNVDTCDCTHQPTTGLRLV